MLKRYKYISLLKMHKQALLLLEWIYVTKQSVETATDICSVS